MRHPSIPINALRGFMYLEISPQEKDLLLSLRDGILEIEIYQFAEYISVVTFVLRNGSIVSLRSRAHDIADRFEVFPIHVTEEAINGEPCKIIKAPEFADICSISVLDKTEWCVLSSEEDKNNMVGCTKAATTQYEGKAIDIPNGAEHSATFSAGIEVKSLNNSSFLVASSINPFDLAISDDESFSKIDPSIYDYTELC